MGDVVLFRSRQEHSANENLQNFILHCKNILTKYEDQGGFNVDTWRHSSGESRYSMVFRNTRILGRKTLITLIV